MCWIILREILTGIQKTGGFLIDNETNEYIYLYPVMDFNQCFLSYDDLDGANCQTVLPEKMTQREAAVEAVRKIGRTQALCTG